MKAVVVYESMFGNTHRVADAIGRGLGRMADVVVVPVQQADRAVIGDADLVVVGGPTHVHGLSRASTRKAAIDQGRASDVLAVDPAAEGPGLREWITSLDSPDTWSAAFDTRVQAPAVVTGRASKGIAKELRHRGLRPMAQPESFLVDKQNRLVPGEEARAEEWGVLLASGVSNPS